MYHTTVQNEARDVILIVDDASQNIEILEGILGEHYRVKAALNGEQALRIAFSLNPPDLILLDIMMPGMDGYDVCRQLKADPQTHSIPVIFVTALGAVVDEIAGFDAGAADFLTKPVVPPVVLSRVRAHLALYHRKRDLERMAVESSTNFLEASVNLEDELRNGVHAQLNLARTLDLLSSVVDSASSGILAVDLNGTITFANMQAARMLGVDHPGDLGARELAAFPLQQPAWDELLTPVLSGGRRSLRTESQLAGSSALLSLHLTPLCTGNQLNGVVITAEDITEKKNLELQLLHASKMATLGEMATGIAHEINQPLNVIRMAAQLIQDSLSEGEFEPDFLKERAEKILAMVLRAVRIINHLRTFGRKNDAEVFTELNLNQPVREAVELLTEKFRLHSITVLLDLAADLPNIAGEAASIEQVLINLLINSVDAFGDMPVVNPPRRNRIEIRSRWHADVGRVRIDVADNGPGLPEELQEKVFEPFFTTKEVGRGTGLGLSISYGIVESHSGSIQAIRRTDSTGTIFRIEFPAITANIYQSEALRANVQNPVSR